MKPQKWLILIMILLTTLSCSSPYPKKILSYSKEILSASQKIFPTNSDNIYPSSVTQAEQDFEAKKNKLGEQHPKTLQSLENLAMAYQFSGRTDKALSLYEKSTLLKEEILGEQHPNTLSSLTQLAGMYSLSGRNDKSLSLFKKIYRIEKETLGEQHPNTLKTLETLKAIEEMPIKNLSSREGLFGYMQQAGLPQAEKDFKDKSEKLGEKHPETLESLEQLAGLYYALGHQKEAVALYEKNYHLKKEIFGEQHPQTIKSLEDLAMIYFFPDQDKALSLYNKIYLLKKEMLGEQHPETLNSLESLASAYLNAGYADKGLALHEKIYQSKQDLLGEKHPETLRSLGSLASVYQKGHLDKALSLAEEHYRMTKKILGERHVDTISSLDSLATIYEQLGRLDDALTLNQKTYQLTEEIYGEEDGKTIYRLDKLISTYRLLDKLDKKALSLAEKNDYLTKAERNYYLTKESFEAGNKTVDSPNSLAFIINAESFVRSAHGLALVYKELGRLDEALSLLEYNYNLAQQVDMTNFTVKSYLSRVQMDLALIYQQQGRLDDALPLLENSYDLAKETWGNKSTSTLLALKHLAIAYAKQGQFQKSMTHLEKFVTEVENLRQGDLSVEDRQAFFGQWVEGYFTLATLYIAQSRFQEAFRLAEMSKARTLLETLTTQLAAQQSGLTPAEQERLQQNEAQLAFLNNRIAQAIKNNNKQLKINLESQKNQLVSQFAQFNHDLMAKYPKYAQLNHVQIIDAPEGAHYLPKDSAFISYFVNENHILAFTLSSDDILTAHDLGEIANLQEQLNAYRNQLALGAARGLVVYKDKPPQDIQLLNRTLWKSLLEPLQASLKNKPNWIISPNGALALIPFETLLEEQAGKTQPVIIQHQISYVQSLSVLKLLQERDEIYKNLKNRGTLLAMGAPIYENNQINHDSQNHPSTTDIKIARALVINSPNLQGQTQALRKLDFKWINLPGTEEELTQLETLFKETQPRIYKGDKATETQLQQLNKQGILTQYRYLVFATHGYLDLEIPALSSIVLGQVNNPPEIDGYVTASEWPSYTLKSDLVTLSACETGVGKPVSGEGIIGLPYAFYIAGNKNTLLTLWSIADDITAEFITRFFSKLKAAQTPAQALAVTKREFIAKGKHYNNYRYWAAFILYGV